MSFPTYAHYKDSGVEWLGEVPAHWEVRRLKTICNFMTGKAHEPFIEEAGDYVCVNARFVSTQGASRKRCSQNLSPARKNDILMVMSVLPNGRALARAYFVHEENEKLAVNQRVCAITVTNGNPTFFYFQLDRNHQLLRYDDCIEQTHLPNGAFSRLLLRVPPIIEQDAIASFLNRETTKLDALITEQRTLIDLLKEKRQAVISHAVTKGLDPRVPMKDSGVEWLGEVPAHWTVCSLLRVIRSIEQGWSPECFARQAEGDEWGVLKAGCVNRGIFNQDENKALPVELSPIPEYEVRAGDVLMSRASGSPELVGSTARVQAVQPRLMLSDKIFRIHLNSSVAPDYFVLALNSISLREQIEQALSGGNGLANNLPQSSLLEFVVCFPQVFEQGEICRRVVEETERIDALTAEAQTTIALLQERRSALISAAVTGKIDVRSTVPEMA